MDSDSQPPPGLHRASTPARAPSQWHPQPTSPGAPGLAEAGRHPRAEAALPVAKLKSSQARACMRQCCTKQRRRRMLGTAAGGIGAVRPAGCTARAAAAAQHATQRIQNKPHQPCTAQRVCAPVLHRSPPAGRHAGAASAGAGCHRTRQRAHGQPQRDSQRLAELRSRGGAQRSDRRRSGHVSAFIESSGAARERRESVEKRG